MKSVRFVFLFINTESVFINNPLLKILFYMKKFFADDKHAVSWGILGLIVLSIFGSLFLIAKIATEVKTLGQNGNPYYNSVSMSGEGEVVAIPDVATFNFGVDETSESVDSAQKMATDKINKALDYLKSKGIEDKDIKTTSYNVNPRYEWKQGICNETYCDNGKNELIGYQVTQNVDVKVRDTTKAGEFLAGIGSFGISNVSGLSFKVDDDEALKSEARAKAIADAKNKIDAVAKELGVKVTRVISFYEETEQPYYGGYGMGGDMMESKAYDTAVAPQLPAGENKITSRVSVTYEIK
jgi:hypothetical protein